MTKKRLQNMDRLSDRQLVALLLDNNDDAIEYVFFHRCDGMFAHIVNSVFLSQDIKKEELIGEFYMYLKADDWRRLRQFQFRSGLNTWLTIVATRFFNERKSQKPNQAVEMTPEIITEMENQCDDYDIFHEMSRLELYEAIDRLPNERERLVIMGALTGKSKELMAEELGCSFATVYALINKTKDSLTKMMKGKVK